MTFHISRLLSTHLIDRYLFVYIRRLNVDVVIWTKSRTFQIHNRPVSNTYCLTKLAKFLQKINRRLKVKTTDRVYDRAHHLLYVSVVIAKLTDFTSFQKTNKVNVSIREGTFCLKPRDFASKNMFAQMIYSSNRWRRRVRLCRISVVRFCCIIISFFLC